MLNLGNVAIILGEIAVGFLLLMLGASLASFFGVLSYRVPRKIDWVKRPSFCESCGRKIAWYENVPIWSYLLLRGRCRKCGKKIPFFYCLWELLGGFFFLWWTWFCYTQSWGVGAALILLAFGEALIYVSLVDGQKHYITNFWLKILLGLTVIFLVAELITGQIGVFQLLGRAVMAGVWGGFFWLVDWTAKKIRHVPTALGSGDALLVMILSGWLTPSASVTMILMAFWSGALVGVGLLSWQSGQEKCQQKKNRRSKGAAKTVTKRRKKIAAGGQQRIAFIPFLAGGFFFALTWAPQFWQWLMW